MLILAIDTSARAGSVAVLRDRHLLASVSSLELTPYDNRLFRDIDDLQNRANFAIQDVDVFAVVVGPGSFTGLRIGLTAVKAWAEIYQRPIAAISGLEAIASQAHAKRSQTREPYTVIAPFQDARRGQIFGAIYRRNGPETAKLELVGEENTLSAVEFLALVTRNAGQSAPILISPTPGLLSDVQVQSAGSFGEPWVVEAASPVLAPIIGQLGFDRAERGELVDSLLLDASYVRRTDAESSWKDS